MFEENLDEREDMGDEEVDLNHEDEKRNEKVSP